MLADVLCQTVSIVTDHVSSKELIPSNVNLKSTAIATTPELLHSTYVEGRYAMLKNLPGPTVTSVDGHAYISLQDCICDVLAHGLDLDVIEHQAAKPAFVTKLSECNHSQKIYSNAMQCNSEDVPPLVLYFNEWSDDFDPSSSSTRNNRGSVWMKSVTIAPPPDQLHSLKYTYPIAIGRKSSSHHVVEQRFAQETLELASGHNNMFYCSSLKKTIAVYVEMMVSLQDQPERRSANCIMLGSGQYTARWGYSANLSAISSWLPACKDCFHSLLHGTVMPGHCATCVNWDFDKDSVLLDFPVPDNYPLDITDDLEKGLRPRQITFGGLKAAVDRTHTAIASGAWSIENAKSYLWVEGLNSDSISAIIECATNARAFNALEADRENYPADYDALLRDRQCRPLLYSIWKIPAQWERGSELTQHVDAVMHLIFLGIVKAAVKRLEDWLKCRNNNDSFISFAVGVLDSVASLNLLWCHVLPYKAGK